MATSIKIPPQMLSEAIAFNDSLAPARLNPRIGAAVTLEVQAHFAEKESAGNKQGWPSQHFYANAARSTSHAESSDRVVISINWQGIRQRIEGGDIRPVEAKYLTIPARSEAYGRRAREFGNLKVLYGKNGPYALAAGEGGATLKVFHGRQASGGDRPVKPTALSSSKGAGEEGLILFWLVKQVHQNPDPTVLPTQEQILDAVHGAITAYVELQRRRGN